MKKIIMLIRNLTALFLFFIGLGILGASDEQGSLGLKIFLFLIVFYPALLLFTKTSHFAKLIFKSPKEALGVLINLPKKALGVLKNLPKKALKFLKNILNMMISKEEISEMKEGFSEVKEALKELKEDNKDDKKEGNGEDNEGGIIGTIISIAVIGGLIFWFLSPSIKDKLEDAIAPTLRDPSSLKIIDYGGPYEGSFMTPMGNGKGIPTNLPSGCSKIESYFVNITGSNAFGGTVRQTYFVFFKDGDIFGTYTAQGGTYLIPSNVSRDCGCG